jgi:hypothetical protein
MFITFLNMKCFNTLLVARSMERNKNIKYHNITRYANFPFLKSQYKKDKHIIYMDGHNLCKNMCSAQLKSIMFLNLPKCVASSSVKCVLVEL